MYIIGLLNNVKIFVIKNSIFLFNIFLGLIFKIDDINCLKID